MAEAATRSKPSSEPKKRVKDDLFENSTMTFGEHLEELRQCLIKAIIWLGLGLALGLTVANQVVRYVSVPLKDAIQVFNAQRDLALLGYDDMDDPAVTSLLPLLTERSLKFQVIYEIPDKLQNLDMSSIQQVATGEEGETVARVEPRKMAEILTGLPDPSALQPKVQLIRDPRGLSTFKVEESFMIWVKAGLIVGAVLSSPMVFYHLWQFIAAGLHRHERRYVYVYLPGERDVICQRCRVGILPGAALCVELPIGVQREHGRCGGAAVDLLHQFCVVAAARVWDRIPIALGHVVLATNRSN